MLQGLVNTCFLFCAWTAANNNLYAASRTLYGMCQGFTKEQNRYFWPLGRTRCRNGAPVIAILASCIFTPLCFLMCKGNPEEARFNGLKLLDISLRLGTVGCLMVWDSHCLAFLRFCFGLEQSVWSRASPNYPYRSKSPTFFHNVRISPFHPPHSLKRCYCVSLPDCTTSTCPSP